MARIQTTSGNGHQARIDVHEILDLRNWARKLGVTPRDVKAAVDAVGSSGEAVAQHLKSWYTAEHSHSRPEGLPSRHPAQGTQRLISTLH